MGRSIGVGFEILIFIFNIFLFLFTGKGGWKQYRLWLAGEFMHTLPCGGKVEGVRGFYVMYLDKYACMDMKKSSPFGHAR